MSATTSIEWTDRTWNPVRGCSVISPGCANCYAMKQAHRFSSPGRAYAGLTKQTKAGPQWTGQIRTVESALLEPLSWRKPARVFVNSMSDLFHECVPRAFIDQVFATMAAGHRHTYQVLTKRADRLRDYMTDPELPERIHWASLDRFGHTKDFDSQVDSWVYGRWPLPNVWIGVSVEDQTRADERIPHLLETPAAVRFVSAEPLLEATDLRLDKGYCRACKQFTKGTITGHCFDPSSPCFEGEMAIGDGIDWVIVGGESGPAARYFNLQWARAIVSQCRATSVPVFVKQLGAKPYEKYEYMGGTFCNPMARYEDGRLRHRKGGDPDEWPEDLRVREFPEVRS